MSKKITALPLYRFRFIAAYIALFAFSLVAFVFVGLHFPGEIRAAEQTSATISHMLSLQNFEPHSIVNAPYHFLQKISLMTLGMSVFSIKLPSLILGVVALIAFAFTIHAWFGRRAALIGTLLAQSLPATIFVLQDGVPTSLFIALFMLVLLSATYAVRPTNYSIFWRILLFLSAGLMLYVPLGIYTLLLMIVIAFINPHTRHVIKKTPRSHYIVATIGTLVIIAPLIYASFLKPTILLSLIGATTSVSTLPQNILQLTNSMFNFLIPGSSHLVQPILPLGYTLLVVVGLYRFATIYYTARSQVLLLSTLVFVPLIALYPSLILYALPLVYILLAMAVHTIIKEWYTLFPFNPYARAFGLIPIALVLLMLGYTSMTRYISSYQYNPQTLQKYSDDLSLLRTHAAKDMTIVTSEEEVAFYQLHKEYNGHTGDITTKLPKEGSVIVSRSAYTKLATAPIPQKIITNSKKEAGDRFYVYNFNKK